MAFSKIVSTAMKICHLTQLNTYLINQKGEMNYHVENVSIPSFMPGSNMEDPIDFFHRIDKEDELYAYINPWGLYYLGYSFLERGQINFIVVGPYLEVVPNIIVYR